MAWNRNLVVTKLKALAAHLSISVVLVAVALALMLWDWFPPPLFATDGGGIGLKLLVLVDLVLGPLLTFIVFNPAKGRRSIAFDLGCIAVFQLAAFGYGLFNIHSVRVQAIAFHEGQFHAVTAASYSEQRIEPGSWQALGPAAPYLVDVREAADGDEAGGVLAFAMTTGLEPPQLQFLYQPYALKAASHWAQGWALNELQLQHPQIAAAAAAWLAAHPQQASAGVRFFRITGYYASAVLVIGRDGQWLGGFAGELPKKTLTPSSSPSPRS